jgi:hypothetical protein
LAGALVLPNSRMLVSMLRIVRSLQPATLAILTCVKDPSSIILRIRSCCDLARFGAIVEEARRFKKLEGQYSDRHVRTAYVAGSVGIAPELVGPLISYPVAGYRAIPVDAPAKAACNPSPCGHVLERLGSSRDYITSACGMRQQPGLGANYCTVRLPMHAGPMGTLVPLTSSAPTERPHLRLPTSS